MGSPQFALVRGAARDLHRSAYGGVYSSAFDVYKPYRRVGVLRLLRWTHQRIHLARLGCGAKNEVPDRRSATRVAGLALRWIGRRGGYLSFDWP
jgi:hypothetical protein